LASRASSYKKAAEELGGQNSALIKQLSYIALIRTRKS